MTTNRRARPDRRVQEQALDRELLARFALMRVPVALGRLFDAEVGPCWARAAYGRLVSQGLLTELPDGRACIADDPWGTSLGEGPPARR